MTKEVFDIAIVGNGASAIATIFSLKNILPKDMLFSIAIIGSKASLGEGKAYKDTDLYLRMNTTASSLSVDSSDASHLLKWLDCYYPEYRYSTYIPRAIYGEYLKKSMQLLMSRAEDNIQYHVFDCRATDSDYSHNEDIYLISNDNGTFVRTRYLVLATGNDSPQDFYDLISNKNYIHDPYPFKSTLTSILSAEKVIILGSGLTAVDILVYLYEERYNGTIQMVSKSGQLPIVKGNIEAYSPKWCKYEFFAERYNKSKKSLSLRDLLRSLRKELRCIQVDWRRIVCYEKEENFTSFQKKINIAEQEKTWLPVLNAIQHEIDRTWRLVNRKDLKNFYKMFLPFILKNLAAVPLENARKILYLLENRKLSISTVNSKNIINELIQKYIVINATGPRKKNSDNIFLNRLKSKGMIFEEYLGGVKACPETGKAISSFPRIYAIGHPTCGIHPLINNIGLIVMNSIGLSKDIKFSILESSKK